LKTTRRKDAHRDYGLTAQRADNALQQVQTAVHGWRSEASRFHIPKAEQNLMAPALSLQRKLGIKGTYDIRYKKKVQLRS
jgi:hypothetical protein